MKRRETTRATGRYAASLKYDVLTALGAYACGGDKHRQRLALRLMTLVTARYNWQDDTVTTGQREIAALWSVDERTVKREMARLREMGWLVLKRASTRGRVACYGLGLDDPDADRTLLGMCRPGFRGADGGQTCGTGVRSDSRGFSSGGRRRMVADRHTIAG